MSYECSHMPLYHPRNQWKTKSKEKKIKLRKIGKRKENQNQIQESKYTIIGSSTTNLILIVSYLVFGTSQRYNPLNDI